MESLEKQRARFQATIEAAGNIEVLDVVTQLENALRNVSKEKCKAAYEDAYVRTGSFERPRFINRCSTNWQPAECSPKDYSRVKQYFESRNPHAFVHCYPPADDERIGVCQVILKPEAVWPSSKQ